MYIKIISFILFLFTIILNTTLEAKELIFHSGDIVYNKPVKGVIFSHKAHVEQKGIVCNTCHSGLFEPKALKLQERPDFVMESLYKGKYCGKCHNGTNAFASDTQCARCHIGVKGYNEYLKTKADIKVTYNIKPEIIIGEGKTSVNFNHTNHSNKHKCDDCHSKHFNMKEGSAKMIMKDLYDGKYCGVCHNGKKAFASTECVKCHKEVPAPKTDLIYHSKVIGPAKFSHNLHSTMFKCEDCHPKLFVMKKGGSKMNMNDMYAGKFCGKCHNGRIATNVTDCARCHKPTSVNKTK